jgi:hypothetical protein
MCLFPSSKIQVPTWMGVPDCTLCKERCQMTCRLNGQEKDMCRLETSGDQIGRSPWVVKAILFFKSFLLRGIPRIPYGIVISFCEEQGDITLMLIITLLSLLQCINNRLVTIQMNKKN